MTEIVRQIDRYRKENMGGEEDEKNIWVKKKYRIVIKEKNGIFIYKI